MADIAAFKRRVSAYAGPSAFRKSALNIRDGGGVFERVLGEGRYRTVLEIGTYRGIAAAYMAQFCERVITIDLLHGKLEQNGERFDRTAFWRQMDVAEKIDLRLVRDDAEKDAVIGALDFDLAFIDGGKNDITQDFARVKKCGAVLFHDVDRRGRRELDAVYDFVMALPRRQVQIMDIFALWQA